MICLGEVKAHEGEWFKVECVVASPDKIILKLNKQSIKTANEIAKRGNIDNFRSHIKTSLKNIPQLNHTCIFGSVSESDYIKATEMFVAAIEKFKIIADDMEKSNMTTESYLYMKITRAAENDENNAEFSFD